jgi:hypothetical protein
MPYIKPEERCQLDPLIEPIVEYVKSLPVSPRTAL